MEFMEYGFNKIDEMMGLLSDSLVFEPSVAGLPGSWQEMDRAVLALSPISLAGMEEVKLMNRTDVKYIVPQSVLPELISHVANDYFIQEIEGRRVADYGTLYLDTDRLFLFRSHVNGKLNRCKWRIRSYLESGLTFLEVKQKTNTGRTLKKRIVYDITNQQSVDIAEDFIRDHSTIDPGTLQPWLQNRFSRMTLVNFQKTERLTIDFNVSFRNCLTGKTVPIPNLAIIELKRDRFSESVAGKTLSERRITRFGISKYCLGMALTNENVKGNLYKAKIRYIHKITHKR